MFQTKEQDKVPEKLLNEMEVIFLIKNQRNCQKDTYRTGEKNLQSQ